mmetsp:Transcript_13556/g.20374  ORF Transcript_13556/g.20374 Transcript_13556/m.20374 type:complete len:274 (-) Transcript_13556:389-1210(-)
MLHKVGEKIFNAHMKKRKDNNVTGSGRGTILDGLCEACEKNTLTKTECLHNIYGLLAGGVETTATALCHAAIMLAEHPEKQERARTEVRKVFLDGKDLTTEVLYSECPYLTAFILETLRLFPPILNAMPRILQKPMKLGDITVPSGTELNVPIWIINRNPKVFGEDAAVFRPERHIGSEELKKRLTDITDRKQNKKFNTFGGGIRACPGRKLGISEVKMMLMLLLMSYKIKCDPKLSPKELSERHWEVTAGVLKPKDTRKPLLVEGVWCSIII